MTRLKVVPIFIPLFVSLIFCSTLSAAETTELKRSKDYRRIKAKVIRKIRLPNGYHEGLYCDGSAIWVLNGRGGKIWVIDTGSGQILSTIEPIASFAEGVTKVSEEEYFTTDWNEKKLYRAKVYGNRMEAESQTSLAPAHPAGVLWTGERLFVIIWTRGFGTKYDLLEMDRDMNILRKIGIQKIEEPAHMAWDGVNLWITSWYSRKVYKIDVDKWEMEGFLRSPAPKATGVVWDGKYLWLTGTYSDLYQLEIM